MHLFVASPSPSPASRAALLHALALLVAVTACNPKAAVEITACDGGDADACELLASRYFLGAGVPRDADLGAMFTHRAAELRFKSCQSGDEAACKKIGARGGFVPLPAVPLDVPRTGGGEAQLIFAVDLPDGKSIMVDGKPIADEAALLAAAKKQIEQSPNLRAVIRADTRVPHGRVIAVLDTLKQAGVSKIAFGVSPVPSASAR